MSSAAQSSLVWKFFKKLDMRKVSCNLCGKEYKTSGNTTNLAAHLKSKHHYAYMQLQRSGKTDTKATSSTTGAEKSSTNLFSANTSNTISGEAHEAVTEEVITNN